MRIIRKRNLKMGLIVMLQLMIIVFVLFFIGDVIMNEKGSILCSIFFGCILIILGIFYILSVIFLNKFGTKINAKIISRNGISRNPFRDRCYINYEIDGKNYTNWVIDKNSNEFQESDEISITVLKKYPKIVMSKYQNNFLMIIMMLIIVIVGVIIVLNNISNLF